MGKKGKGRPDGWDEVEFGYLGKGVLRLGKV